jgi:hypothetical protein
MSTQQQGPQEKCHKFLTPIRCGPHLKACTKPHFTYPAACSTSGPGPSCCASPSHPSTASHAAAALGLPAAPDAESAASSSSSCSRLRSVMLWLPEAPLALLVWLPGYAVAPLALLRVLPGGVACKSRAADTIVIFMKPLTQCVF